MLGEVRALVDGQPVALGPARQRSVLAILLVEAGRTVSLDQLTDRLWGQAPPQRSKETLHSYLSRLRAVLPIEAGVHRGDGGYLLKVDEATVDLHRFRALLTRAKASDDVTAAALYERALKLWHGEPFAGLDCRWLADVRRRLQDERHSALLDHYDLQLRKGQHGALMADLALLAAEHPLDERVAGQFILALYRNGRQADALAHYERTRRQLVEELGIDPGPELRHLHQLILGSDPALTTIAPAGAQPVPRQLPAPPSAFAGRARELAVLDQAQARVYTIGGMGGIGKTWLALHWAHRDPRRFPDGQLYVDLHGFGPSDAPISPEAALRDFLGALGVDPAGIPVEPHAQAALYRTLVADKQMLIVLDNARDTDQVTPLLPGSPTCTVLVTSRHELPGLVTGHGALPISLDTLNAADARLLLLQRLGRDRTLAEPQAMDDLLERCAGHPLALSIVAARALMRPKLSLAALVEELRTPLHALDTGEPVASLAAVLSWSYHALSPQAGRLFRLIGVHPGPDLGLAAAAGLAGLPVHRLKPLLAELLRAHLVTEHASGRYSMHDLLRAYAADLADEHGERVPALRRALSHYLHTAHAAAKRLYPTRDPIPLPEADANVAAESMNDSRQATAWFTAEQAVLLACVRQSAEAGLTAYTWRLAWTLVKPLDERARWNDLHAIQDLALRAAAADPLGQAHSHAGLASARIRLGRHDDAAADLEAALDLFTGLGDRVGQARMHHDLGWLHGAQGHFDKALLHLRRSLTLYEAEDHRHGMAITLNDLGWCNALLGRYDETLSLCEQGLRLHQESESLGGQVAGWDSLGYAHHHLGDHAMAIDCYENALRLERQIDAPYRKAEILTHLGDTHLATGDTDAARHCWRQARDILEGLHHGDADQVRARLDDLGDP